MGSFRKITGKNGNNWIRVK